MNKISINDLIKENKILLFFLDERISTRTLVLRHFFAFFLVPIILFVISSFKGILFVGGIDSLGHNKVGMLEDYLFFAFALVTAQFSLIVLRIILKRFIRFMQEIPSFTKNLDQKAYNSLITECVHYVTKRHFLITLIKYSYLTISLFTNFKAHFWREGGWNSSAHMLVFGIWLIVLVITIGTVLPQTIGKYLVVIAGQIKLTKKLEKNNHIKVQPIAPDKAGGLKSLGELSLSFTYFLVPFMFQIVMHSFTWKFTTLGLVIGMAALIPLTIFVFFFPFECSASGNGRGKAYNTQGDQRYVCRNQSVSYG